VIGLRKSPLCALALCALVRAAPAEVRKPPLPPGRDPGGVAIALFTTGIDYTDPEVAGRLARDGEGELIGWDVADGDNRPFAARGSANWGGDGTLLARALGSPGRRLVAVRISPADPASLARAVAFIAATPARVAVVPMWSSAKAAWEPFRQAVLQHGDLLLIAAAGDEGKDIDRQPVWPAAFQLANVLVVTAPQGPQAGAGDATPAPNGGARLVDAVVAGGEGRSPPANTSLAAMLAADALAGCWPQLLAAHRGEALKAALLAEAAKAQGTANKPVISGCARGSPPHGAPRHLHRRARGY
jgi:hypothetical protein